MVITAVAVGTRGDVKLDTDADHVMQYLVAEYKTSIDFMKGMFKP